MPVNSQRHIFLIAEDEPLIAMDIEDILRRNGAQSFVFARSCAEIDRHLADGARFHAAIVDIRLSDGSSLDVARRLSAQGARVVFATGDGSALPADLARWPVIAKPFGEEELQAALAKAQIQA